MSEKKKLKLATIVSEGEVTHFAEVFTVCSRVALGHRESEVTHYKNRCLYCETGGGYISEAFFVLRNGFRYIRRVIYEDKSPEIQVSNDLKKWMVYVRET